MVDVLAGVVGVEAHDLERELIKHLLDHGQHAGLGEGVIRGDHLPLSHAVDRVDVVRPPDAVVVALVDAVDADEAGPAFECWGAAHADAALLVVDSSLRCRADCFSLPGRLSFSALPQPDEVVIRFGRISAVRLFIRRTASILRASSWLE